VIVDGEVKPFEWDWKYDDVEVYEEGLGKRKKKK
jgi:hypothetical protein